MSDGDNPCLPDSLEEVTYQVEDDRFLRSVRLPGGAVLGPYVVARGVNVFFAELKDDGMLQLQLSYLEGERLRETSADVFRWTEEP